jgi:hypothetical protein
MSTVRSTTVIKPKAPKWLRIKVTRDDIGRAIMAKSTGCAISDAVVRTYPNTRRPVSDIRSLKVTFPELGVRAEYKMSLAGAHFIVRFDRGDSDLDEFSLRLPLVVEAPIAVRKAAADKRAARHEARQTKLALGKALTSDEVRAEKLYQGLPRPTTEGPAVHIPGPAGAVQIGGTLTPTAPGASGPSINEWGQSGQSKGKGKRPTHYRGFGVHGLGQIDPAVLATAGEVYDEHQEQK